ncbi:MAG: Yip1 family protein, partial [Candidatus Thorarchaeota archaeon]
EFCDSPVPADATICPVCKETIAEETLERILPILKRPESPDVKFMSATERMWGVIRRPAPTYRDIGQRPDAAGPFLIIVINALIIAGLFLSLSSKVTTLVIVNATSGEIGPANLLFSPQGGMNWVVGLVGIMPSIMIGLIYLVVGTAFAHFAFKLTGGTGSKLKTLSVIGYSMMPVILVRLFSLLVVLIAMPAYPDIVPFDSGSLAALTPTVVDWAYTSTIWTTLDYLMTGAFLWTGYLLIFGIREAHDTSTVWATLVSIACVIVLLWTFWQVH